MQELQQHTATTDILISPSPLLHFQVGEQNILHTRSFGSKSYDGHKSQLITHLTIVAICVQISSADLATIKRLM